MATRSRRSRPGRSRSRKPVRRLDANGGGSRGQCIMCKTQPISKKKKKKPPKKKKKRYSVVAAFHRASRYLRFHQRLSATYGRNAACVVLRFVRSVYDGASWRGSGFPGTRGYFLLARLLVTAANSLPGADSEDADRTFPVAICEFQVVRHREGMPVGDGSRRLRWLLRDQSLFIIRWLRQVK